MPAISLIMPCYNREYDIRRILQAYEQQDAQTAFELIAVDDSSTDRTYSLLQAYQPRRFTLKVERTPVNMGPAAARNRGIAHAESPLVCFVGDDIYPLEGFVSGHLRAHQVHPRHQTAILGKVVWGPDMSQNTLMQHIDGIGAQQFSYHYMRAENEYDYRHLYTCNVSLKTSFLLSEKKWFDEEFPYPAYEDAELGYRLAKRGLKIRYQPEILGYHYHYHTIWSFARRQFNSGKMSLVIIRKHPGVLKILRGQYRRLANLFFPSLAVCQPYPQGFSDQLWQKTLELLSFYEWQPFKFVDWVYLKALEFSYYNGFIDGVFGNSRLFRRVQDAHTRLYLVPMLRRFFDEAEKDNIPLPAGYGRWMLPAN